MVPERIDREVLIEAPPDVVWAVVTQPEHIAGWFSDSAEVDLRPGGKLTLVWEGHDDAHGLVEKVEPPRYFSFRWIRRAEAELHRGNSTLVEFTLTPEGAGTRLRVVESGFRDLDWPEEDRSRYADENRQGWKLEFDELREYIRRQAPASGRR